MSQEDELVRCQCGYIMRRRPERPTMGETWPCYAWHHRSAPERLHYCPICGVAPSLLSTSPVGAEKGRMRPRDKTRRGVSSTTAGKMADATGRA
jgi:hypothetical protein